MSGVVAAVGVYSAYNTNRQNKKNRAALSSAFNQENDWRQRSLDYQIEQDKLPTQYREGALTRLNDIYQGGAGQENFINQAKNSELYKNLMGTGEEAILRNASATGGLRSGSAQTNLAEFSKGALLDTYNTQIAGLQGMAGLPSNVNNIANSMNAIGKSKSQLTMANRRMSQDANTAQMNLLGQGLQAYGAYKYSDIRAKDNIRFIGRENGHKIYTWVWNEAGEFLGLKGKGRGVMAHEVYETHPEAIKIDNGVLMVNYGMLGVNHV